MSGPILCINGGSSSVKFALYTRQPSLELQFRGSINRVGVSDSALKVCDAAGKDIEHRAVKAKDLQEAAEELVRWLSEKKAMDSLAVIGHRLVHGGPRYRTAALITEEMLSELDRLIPIDPDHLPGELALIRTFTTRCPKVPQVACFDTAFHRELPRVAKLLPIPRRYEATGIYRYGFHGLSFEYLLEELKRSAGKEAARGRVILAHLGAGASLAAVKDGRCIDTTMAFSPTAGLMMGTRSGDLDPGLLVYLMREEKMSAADVDELVNRRSGLAGVSEITSDMRELLTKEDDDPRAAEAIELFCYLARKWIGAMAAALDGLDALVFSGGIGENVPQIRSRICVGLAHLGVEIDASRNRARQQVISTGRKPVAVWVIPTNEERKIAELAAEIVQANPA